MSDTRNIKAKLERTKQLVAEMHEEKRRKAEERKKKESEVQQMAECASDDSDLDRKKSEISQEPPLVPTPMSPSSQSVSASSENGSQESVEGGTMARTLQWDMDPSALQLLADAEHRCVMKRLETSEIVQIDYIPKKLVTYCKETQTPVAPNLSEEEEKEDEELPVVQPKPQSEEHLVTDNQETMQEHPKELTEEEKQQIVQSEDFLIFFDRSIRLVERTLAEDLDIFFDYSGRDMEDREGDTQAGLNLSFNQQFYDEQWSKHRVVTCLDWSPQYSELLMASYNANEHAPQEPDGVVLLWNMKFKKTIPEYIFHCQSSVMSVGFAQFHPNLIVGGTYSGQIALWDNRSPRRTPVQRTPLSAAAHTHPVSSVNVVGTQNANSLITVSTDGKMCSWSLDMLSQPQDSMELYYNKSKVVAVTGMAFPVGDVNNFVVGSEEGTVYTASRHGSKAGISEMFEGHQGPVTGISCHNAVGPIDFSNLFTTSSFDWTAKLWSTKHNKPLYSFEDSVDYVYDVMWSPVHPAVFATVDGIGRLDIWNLNKDKEVPTASVTVEGSFALNRVRWASGGREVAAGDSEGRVWIYDVGEQLAVPHSEDWSRLAQVLVEIRANADGDVTG
ncbi:cytoplasmic dynein 1 intermediate chain 1 isoform X1 [Ictalurus furcatus]|uniref:cytoplasmic dynein 1 intermediate chain 1 isoform X1 n=1 Tax=Ictalurus furcatus TaxID=66913 RepID=UPI00234FC24B|nr:cytoplasmic dynein 1 intermediate chain 1 isoform X1 [Ictalurus furcatus]